MKKIFPEKLIVLTQIQKKQFLESLPSKIYKTERNIALVVAATQIVMILLFLSNQQASFNTTRGPYFFFLYLFLLVATVMAIILYRYTYTNKKLTAFLYLRRIYAGMICLWVIGITYLEQMNGGSSVTYSYFLPTMAALLLLTPMESTILFGFSWLAITSIFISNGNTYAAFSNITNSIFATILTLFISYRYYHSMAVEFCDRQIISYQYQEIEKNNTLLQEMAHIDQLTNLYNRHYLIETLYPWFEECKSKQYYGMFLMLDIDYFKQYNDTYGHIQGDACLKIISNQIKLLALQYGLTAIRYGGEEFLIIKLDKKPIDALMIANMLLKAIEDLNLVREDTELKKVSTSIGLWSQSLVEIPHIEAAIKKADTALYEAKNKGRNCIVDSHSDNI